MQSDAEYLLRMPVGYYWVIIVATERWDKQSQPIVGFTTGQVSAVLCRSVITVTVVSSALYLWVNCYVYYE